MESRAVLSPQVRFGVALRNERTSRGLSQEGLAHLAGLDRTYVSGVERGVRNPTVESMWRLAEALGCPLSTIVAAAEAVKSGA